MTNITRRQKKSQTVPEGILGPRSRWCMEQEQPSWVSTLAMHEFPAQSRCREEDTFLSGPRRHSGSTASRIVVGQPTYLSGMGRM